MDISTAQLILERRYKEEDLYEIFKIGQNNPHLSKLIVDEWIKNNKPIKAKAIQPQKCKCGNVLTEKELYYETCLHCNDVVI